jgi:hypothetical protein
MGVGSTRRAVLLGQVEKTEGTYEGQGDGIVSIIAWNALPLGT